MIAKIGLIRFTQSYTERVVKIVLETESPFFRYDEVKESKTRDLTWLKSEKNERKDVVEIYKRSSSILNSEIIKNKLELSNSVDTGLFKSDRAWSRQDLCL